MVNDFHDGLRLFLTTYKIIIITIINNNNNNNDYNNNNYYWLGCHLEKKGILPGIVS